MNSIGLAFLVAAAVAMLIDWWAVWSEQTKFERVAKPAVMIALLGAALVIDMEPSTLRPWIVVALLAGLIGDVVLLPEIDFFLGGLGAFFVGHVAYAVAFGLAWEAAWPIWVAIAAYGVLTATVASPVLRAVRTSKLFVPVLAYVVVSGLVVVLAGATGRWLLLLGAFTFTVSDSLLGHGRWVDERGQRRTLVHITYHVGQATILLGTISAANA